QGLPSPAAAALLAGLIWFGESYGLASSVLVATPALFITIAAGGLMVSNIRFHSFKDVDLRGRVPFVTVLLVLALFVLISLDPSLVLFLAAAGYALSGPILTLTHVRRRRAERRAAASRSQD
ncbi:MAG: CDP-diacylglycerol--serine O-phosphatidyltransferase, partial [Gammaproteobacteria bacterium]|nr:CDP-diacylglycerol--serine O-phosphatidyltransferase [Gammaproteobacteria bacterium]